MAVNYQVNNPNHCHHYHQGPGYLPPSAGDPDWSWSCFITGGESTIHQNLVSSMKNIPVANIWYWKTFLVFQILLNADLITKFQYWDYSIGDNPAKIWIFVIKSLDCISSKNFNSFRENTNDELRVREDIKLIPWPRSQYLITNKWSDLVQNID